MTEPLPQRPARSEYADFYSGYVDQVPDGDVLEVLEEQLQASLDLFSSLAPDTIDHRYAPEKWTIREVLGHVIDAERIFAYRALRFARGDATPLPGMDQEEFMAGADFSSRPMESLVDEYRHLRLANLALFRSFDDEVMDRTGEASGCRFTVRALVYIVAGHERHHVRLLREWYL